MQNRHIFSGAVGDVFVFTRASWNMVAESFLVVPIPYLLVQQTLVSSDWRHHIVGSVTIIIKDEQILATYTVFYHQCAYCGYVMI